VRRQLPLLVLIGAMAGFLALVIAGRMSGNYKVYFSYLISLSEQQTTDDYKFDGYYVLQATELFGETLAAWVRTPEVLVAAHERGGLVLASEDPRHLGGLVEARQEAPQLVTVVVQGKSRDRAEKLARGLQDEMEERVRQYQFEVVPTATWTGKNQIAAPVVAGTVFVFVFLLGINFVLLREALHENSD